ncbi:MAG TPA: SWIM zinc finger family protein [Gemmatimonadaceae bacterium]|nr:SWIM zinc finger family protein [Gemmatimonadaceae bacterium]
MPFALTIDQVAALAPDAASLAAGKKLAASRDWSNVAHDARALWGECKGSALYQVRVDLSDLSAKCSCPSRKFPCKHALGLLLKAAADPAGIVTLDAPDWVEDWIARRGAAAEKKEAKAAAAAAPVDEQAQARRAQKRAARVDEGIAALDLWLADLVRNGLASVADKGAELWESQAARLVDAQAPGLAARLRRVGEVPRSAPDWTRRVLIELGRIALVTEAYRRLDALDDPLRDDVRALVGWTLKDEEVIARGTAVEDRWLVIGQRTEDEAQLRVQRTWLLGLESGRYALVLQFAVGLAPFSESLIPGTLFDARVRYWPSAHPSRALVEERRGSPESWSGERVGYTGFDDLLGATTSALAAQPWLDRLPCVVRDVRPARRDAARWHLVDDAGRALPLASRDHRRLLAISGGHPMHVAAEWDGETLLPLAAMLGDDFNRLSN